MGCCCYSYTQLIPKLHLSRKVTIGTIVGFTTAICSHLKQMGSLSLVACQEDPYALRCTNFTRGLHPEVNNLYHPLNLLKTIKDRIYDTSTNQGHLPTHLSKPPILFRNQPVFSLNPILSINHVIQIISKFPHIIKSISF